MVDSLIYDPVRRKNVPLTPEEKVRQWFIQVLHNDLEVPLERMGVEVGMKWGEDISGIGSKSKRKIFRADIVLYGRNSRPVMIVECKEEGVELGYEVLLQATKYGSILSVDFLALTNGLRTIFLRRKVNPETSSSTYEVMDHAPKWDEINPGKQSQG